MPAFAENLATLSDLLMKGKSEQVQMNEAQEHAYSLLKEYLLQECLEVVWGVEDIPGKENIGADFWSGTGYC